MGNFSPDTMVLGAGGLSRDRSVFRRYPDDIFTVPIWMERRLKGVWQLVYFVKAGGSKGLGSQSDLVLDLMCRRDRWGATSGRCRLPAL
jgi:hypothetical protein